MARYRFIKTGNFVDFYDQAMHVIKLHDTSRCITWTFDDTVGVNFKIDEMIYHSDLMSEISFDGVACTSHADFKAGILAMFPEAGGEGGGIATIGNPVSASDAKGGVITGSELALYLANTSGPGMVSTGNQGFLGDKTFNGKLIANDQLQIQDDARFRSQDASGFFATLSAPNLTANRTWTFPDDDGVLGGGSGIDTVLAIGQVLTADREIELDGHEFEILNDDHPWWYAKPETGEHYLQSFFNQNDGNNAVIGLVTGTDVATVNIYSSFNDGTKDASIILTSNPTQGLIAIEADDAITYTADTHTFNGDTIIADLAGGGTTGLSIDNDGKIIRTP